MQARVVRGGCGLLINLFPCFVNRVMIFHQTIFYYKIQSVCVFVCLCVCVSMLVCSPGIGSQTMCPTVMEPLQVTQCVQVKVKD